jgi:hypothetical protein
MGRRLKYVRHALVEIKFHINPGHVHGPVEPHEGAQHLFLDPALDQARREAFGIVPINRRGARVLLIFGVCIGIRAGFDMQAVGEKRLGIPFSRSRILRVAPTGSNRHSHLIVQRIGIGSLAGANPNLGKSRRHLHP